MLKNFKWNERENLEEEMKDKIGCPLTDGMIELMDCVVCSDTASGMLKEYCIPDKFKQKRNWRDICKNCIYHEM